MSTSKVDAALVDFYLDAKSTLLSYGYGEEIDRQEDIDFDEITETDFLREAAWVVLSCGMRESVIRSKFPAVSEAFLQWRNVERIVANRELCVGNALKIFGHRGKIEAIWTICNIAAQRGLALLKEKITAEGVDYLTTLPYVGPVTAYHLAKNLGLNVVKPDRHLSRICSLSGYATPLQMCETVAAVVGDKVSVIDTVIWRYATLFSYDKLFSDAESSVSAP